MTSATIRKRPIRSDNVDPRMPASIVVSKFGGLSRFCEWTGYKSSTVWNWLVKGYVPADRQTHVLDMAKLHGVEVDPADFVYNPGGTSE